MSIGLRVVRVPLCLLLLSFFAGSAARAAERIELVSRAMPELVSDTGGFNSTLPIAANDVVRQVVSADGRYVAFISSASNLVPGQVENNSATDIFLYDRANGTMQLASHAPAGAAVTGNGASLNPSISADGRYVAFSSGATNLISGSDTNGGEDVFLFDRDTGAVTLVSHAASSAVTAASLVSTNPMISADGSRVAFNSTANNLVTGQVDTAGLNDVFLWSRATNTSQLVSHASTGAANAANGSSTLPVLSADGSWVAYTSAATNLVTGGIDNNLNTDVFLWSQATNANQIASRLSTSPTVAGNGTANFARISADGAFVLFVGDGTSYVTGQVDTSFTLDLFLYSRATGTVTLVSHTAASPLTAGNSNIALGGALALSADGNWVAFASPGTNYVTGQIDTNSQADIFLWSRASGAISLVSRRAGTTATASATPSAATSNVEISANGGVVAYATRATELVAGQVDTNGLADLFVFDRDAGTNRLVSGANGSVTLAAADSFSKSPALSADGQWVAWVTQATNIVPGVIDTNMADDVFLTDRVGGETLLVSRRDAALPSDSAAGNSTLPAVNQVAHSALSADGRYVVFQSFGDRLVPGQVDTNGATDVFHYDRQTGLISLVSRVDGTTATTGFGVSQGAVISADGRWVAFVSTTPNLVAGQIDPFSTNDVFLWDSQTGNLTLLSRAASNPVLTVGGTEPALSFDGSSVAFTSSGQNLVPGQSDLSTNPDIFLYDRATGATTLVSHRSTGATVAAGGSGSPGISTDGRYVSFSSSASNIITGMVDVSGADIFTWDRATGIVTLVTHSAASSLTAVASLSYQMSADGNWITFSSSSTAVVPGQIDTNGGPDIFLWERATNTNRLVSHTPAGAATAGNMSQFTQQSSLSADGSRVVFLSLANNLVSGGTDTNNGLDVFLFDRSTGQVSLASHTSAGPNVAGSAAATRIAISADGSRVAFSSPAVNLVAGQTDTAGTSDVFLYDAGTGAVRLLSRRQTAATAAGTGSEGGALSANGDAVVFISPDNNLVPNDHNGRTDVFLWIDESGTDLAIAKTNGVESVTPGETVTWLITATNSGPLPVSGALVTDAFPAALQGVTWTCAAGGGASCAASGAGTLSQSVDLPVNGTVTFTVTGTVAADASGTLANTASITPAGGVTDTNPANNSSTDMDTLTPRADLLIAMTDSPDPVGRGATLTYTILVTNAGPSAAASVTVVDTLPAGTSFTGAAGDGWSCGEAGGVVTCTRPSLAPGSAPALSIQATAPVARGFATLSNAVAVTAATPDPVANNGASTETAVPQPGITVAPVSGLTTTEAGGTATFTVVLDNAPLADVTVSFTSGDTAEGTVDPASLTFTTADWSTPKTVTITGVNDDYDDGDVAFTVTTGPAASTDAGYAGIDPADVAANNQDDDAAGFTVTPIDGLTTTEAGGTDTFTVVLKARPRADVTIALTSDDTNEGTVEPASLTFTTNDWSTPKTVTVTGVDDAYDDGTVSYTITTGAAESADAAWAGLDPADVAATNQDDDTAGITVAPVEGLLTTEQGGTATFTVSLVARPAQDVTIALESSDAGEGLPSPDSLTFTPENWETPQTVTVTGQNDDLRDGNVAYTIIVHPAQSGDAAFAGIDPTDVSAINQDDSYEGVFYTVTPCRLVDTNEPGYGPALQNNQVAVVEVFGACGVPPTARAVAMNLTFSAAGQRGQVLVFPGDLTQPPVAEYLWIEAGRFARSLATIMPLGADGTLAILPQLKAPRLNPTVHVALDVTGYFE